jgi:DNA-binding NarL/FixJ family response regulator
LRRWLVLDDRFTDQLLAQTAVAMVDESIEVVLCSHGSEVMDALREKDIEVCLLDYYLKGKATSRQIITAIRNTHPSTKTIILSGMSHSDSGLFRLGADAVAVKTGSAHSLSVELKRALLDAERNRQQRILRTRVQEPYVLPSERHRLGHILRLNSGNLMVCGHAGMGKSSVGLMLAERLRERNPGSHGDPLQIVSLKEMNTSGPAAFEQASHELFFGSSDTPGSLERFRESVHFVDDAHLLPQSVQDRLVEVYRNGGLRRRDGYILRSDRLRMVFAASREFEDNITPAFRSTVVGQFVTLPEFKDYLAALGDVVRYLVRREARRRGVVAMCVERGFLGALREELDGYTHAVSLRSLARGIELGVEAAVANSCDALTKFDVKGFRHALLDSGSALIAEGDRSISVPQGLNANLMKDFVRHMMGRSYKENCQLLFGILYDGHMKAYGGNKTAAARAMKVSMKKFYEGVCH